MESIDAGDIGAGVGFKDIRTGDTLCDEDHPIVLESMTFPDTVISIAVFSVSIIAALRNLLSCGSVLRHTSQLHPSEGTLRVTNI